MRKGIIIKIGMTLCFCLLMCGNTYAQNLKSILSGVANAVVGNSSSATATSIVGTWKYTGPDCKFESDNLLAKAGGELAASKVEKKMSTVMQKLGFTKGATFVFNSDNTYTSTVNGRSISGTYTFDSSSKTLLLKSRLGVKFSATVSQSALSSNTMSLLFKADKLMTLAKTVSGTVGKAASSSVLTTANSLLKNYDGLQLGVALEKQ